MAKLTDYFNAIPKRERNASFVPVDVMSTPKTRAPPVFIDPAVSNETLIKRLGEGMYGQGENLLWELGVTDLVTRGWCKLSRRETSKRGDKGKCL